MKYLFLLVTLFALFSCSSVDEPQQENTPISEGKPYTILALGDSLTAGYGVEESINYPSQLGDILREQGYNYGIINAGVSGDTSQNLLDRADLYLDKNPDILLLVIGGNDGLRGQSTLTMKENIQKIIDLYTPTGAKIVLGAIDLPMNLGLDYRADFRQVYKDIAQENSDIYLLPSFLGDVAGDAALNLPDRIHPTGEGYAIIVDNLFAFLKKNKILTQ